MIFTLVSGRATARHSSRKARKPGRTRAHHSLARTRVATWCGRWSHYVRKAWSHQPGCNKGALSLKWSPDCNQRLVISCKTTTAGGVFVSASTSPHGRGTKTCLMASIQGRTNGSAAPAAHLRSHQSRRFRHRTDPRCSIASNPYSPASAPACMGGADCVRLAGAQERRLAER